MLFKFKLKFLRFIHIEVCDSNLLALVAVL